MYVQRLNEIFQKLLGEKDHEKRVLLRDDYNALVMNKREFYLIDKSSYLIGLIVCDQDTFDIMYDSLKMSEKDTKIWVSEFDNRKIKRIMSDLGLLKYLLDS